MIHFVTLVNMGRKLVFYGNYVEINTRVFLWGKNLLQVSVFLDIL